MKGFYFFLGLGAIGLFAVICPVLASVLFSLYCLSVLINFLVALGGRIERLNRFEQEQKMKAARNAYYANQTSSQEDIRENKMSGSEREEKLAQIHKIFSRS